MKTKYELNENVYVITQQKTNIQLECQYCDNGKITCKNNKTIECPKCNGSGSYMDIGLKYVVLNKARINNIKTTTTTNGLIFIIYKVIVNGFSFYVSENDMFKFYSVAYEECNRRNSIK